MNYASLRKCDIANGEGVRVSLFVSGCTHRCKGCFNEEAQDFAYGRPFTAAVEDEILDALAPDYIAGLTVLGGEPMEPANQRALLPFLERVRARYGSAKTIWIYTGCVLEDELLERPDGTGTRWRTESTDRMLELADVLVDGPYDESLRNLTLKFRGSSNQRIIRLHDGECASVQAPQEGSVK